MSTTTNETLWSQLHGASLEPSLRVDNAWGEAPIRLLDARYLLKLAGYEEEGLMRGCDGDVPKYVRRRDTVEQLPRRQDLPDEAFLALEDVRRLPHLEERSVRCLVVSHPWAAPHHPDPSGYTLRVLALGALAALVLLVHRREVH